MSTHIRTVFIMLICARGQICEISLDDCGFERCYAGEARKPCPISSWLEIVRPGPRQLMTGCAELWPLYVAVKLPGTDFFGCDRIVEVGMSYTAAEMIRFNR